MVFYPYHTALREAVGSHSVSNFGLWFNKLIPLADSVKFQASNKKGEHEEAVSYYAEQYDLIRNNKFIRDGLMDRHVKQMNYYKKNQNRYKILVVSAELTCPMVLGLGESHPVETSLIFDHNLGIPYIPASSLKGVVRFAHSLGLLEDDAGGLSHRFVLQNDKGQEVLDEENRETLIPQMFGGDQWDPEKEKTYKCRGQIHFLDAYPETVPDLKVDIMNPHYGDYYGDKPKPPSDCSEPTPVKFLTVKEGTEFIFRILVPKGKDNLFARAESALFRALEVEGLGAKTAAGYGRFKINRTEEPTKLKAEYCQRYCTPIERFLSKLEGVEKGNRARIDELFDQWQGDELICDSNEIAKKFKPLVKKKKANGDWTMQYAIICKLLGEEDETGADATDEEKGASASRQLTHEEQKFVAKMKKFVAKGSISKKELKKLKAHKDLAPDLYEQLQNLLRK